MNENDFQYLVGKQLNEASDEVKNMGIPCRVCGPCSIITADYRPERINLHYNENRVIVSVDFG